MSNSSVALEYLAICMLLLTLAQKQRTSLHCATGVKLAPSVNVISSVGVRVLSTTIHVYTFT